MSILPKTYQLISYLFQFSLSVNIEIINTKRSGEKIRLNGFMYTNKHVGKLIT